MMMMMMAMMTMMVMMRGATYSGLEV